MACLSKTTADRIRARILSKESLLEKYYTAVDDIAANPLQEYWFESADGQQRAKRWSPKMLDSVIRRLEIEIDHLYDRLYGRGIARVNVRRKPNSGRA